MQSIGNSDDSLSLFYLCLSNYKQLRLMVSVAKATSHSAHDLQNKVLLSVKL